MPFPALTDRRDRYLRHCPFHQVKRALFSSTRPGPPSPSLTSCPFARGNHFTSPVRNHEDCALWQVINQSWESRGQIPGLLIFNIRCVESGEYFMKGLLHFNTSMAPTPRTWVNYSHPNLKDFSPLSPFSSPPATPSPLGRTYLEHTHSVEDAGHDAGG